MSYAHAMRAVLFADGAVSVWILSPEDADVLHRVLPTLARGPGDDALLTLVGPRCEDHPLAAADARLVATVLASLAGEPAARASLRGRTPAPEPEVLGPETVLV